MGMTQWMFYLVAIAVSGVVILLVAKTSMDGQETAINAQTFQMVKKRQFAAIQTIERDFRNIGASKRNVSNAITALDTTCTTSDWCTVSFWTRVDDDTLLNDPNLGLVNPANRDSIEVEYSWRYEFADAGLISDYDLDAMDAMKAVTLLNWRRRIRPAGGAWATTNELHTLVDFKVRPFNLVGSITTVGSLVRQFYIEVEALTPRGMNKDNVDVSRWETYVRPANLTRLDQEE
jgi:hypothetical protein